MKELSELVSHLKIDKWDILLIGDGSGGAWGNCGWACLSVEKEGFKRKVWYGSMNEGTINIAEYMAYIQPLIAFSQKKSDVMRYVHIITDSQVVQAANTKYICGKFLANFLAFGLIVKTHWLQRETIESNRLVDFISKYAREDVKKSVYDKVAIANLGKKDLYEIEPTS